MFEQLLHGVGPGAREEELSTCEAKLGILLPDALRTFLKHLNGFNDEIGRGYLVLWNTDELVFGIDYELFQHTPGRLLIGSNGGSTAYGIFDGNYIAIPLAFAGPFENEIRILSHDFAGFVKAVAAGEGW